MTFGRCFAAPHRSTTGDSLYGGPRHDQKTAPATSLAAPLLRSAAASPTTSSKVLKNMGSAGPGLGARIQAMGKNWDIVEYCHEKGLGAAHTSLPADLEPAAVKKLRDQIEKYDMRLDGRFAYSSDRRRSGALRGECQGSFRDGRPRGMCPRLVFRTPL